MFINFKLFSKIFYAFSILLLIIFTGTVGYTLVEGWTLFESFYMTIITISTVGFQEVHSLSNGGRLFTALLIITSFGTFAYAISAITSYLMGGEYKKYFIQYRLEREISKLKNHVIVCGFGRVGSQAGRVLTMHKRDFIILEKDEALEESIRIEHKFLVKQADATNDEHLKSVGIEHAKALITTLPKDADNLFVVLTAKELNPNLIIISRASNASSVKKLKIAGANNVIMPDILGGSHMASLVVTPDVMEFLDHISIQGQAEANLEEISFSELPANFKYSTIGALSVEELQGCNIIGLKNARGEYIINPHADTEITPNLKLFVLGSPQQISKLNFSLNS